MEAVTPVLKSGLWLMAAGWAGAAAAMAVCWAAARRLGNHGIVDVGWTYVVAGLAVCLAMTGPGAPIRRGFVASMFLVWGVRLGTYLLVDRVIGKAEDGRYARLRRSWGAAADRRFFWFYQAQALAAVFFAMPALFPSHDAEPSPAVLAYAGFAVWVVGVCGESCADWQLHRFRSRPENRNRTCRSGVWRYSRHPNYFFEWLVWVGFALLAMESPLGLLALACPLVMLYLLFNVTGIPATEAQALASRGADYGAYQETTSAFVPWFPRSRPSVPASPGSTPSQASGGAQP